MKLCGIDEAGRGPLAGPLVMAGVILNNSITGLNDSKKLSEKKREILFDIILTNSDSKIVRFSAQQIDTLGLSACLKMGLEEIMNSLNAEDYLFDGNSKFGVSGLRTLIKADALIAEVSAASILAKVTRDREMVQLDTLYPHYGFAEHKGYGTCAHVQAIQKHGHCEIHRKSFKLKALQGTLF